MASKLLMLWLGLSLGTALVTFITAGPLEKIFERSFFQGVALFAAWLLLK